MSHPINLIMHKDCLEFFAGLPDNSIDGAVTDPPYGIGFMEKEFDKLGDGPAQQAWHARWLKGLFRVLKPGAHVAAFGSPRTYHRLACAAEDVGFEIRDSLLWIYGSGFPKSKSVAMSIDKELKEMGPRGKAFTHAGDVSHLQSMEGQAGAHGQHEGISPQAQEWQGWQTALTPAHEPILLDRKPLSEGSVARNVLKHRTGGLNIDPVRGPGTRWPKNVIFTPNEDENDCPVTELERQYANAPRFFYCAKAAKGEREAGCKGLKTKQQDTTRKEGRPGGDNPRNRGAKQRKNFHPTVKPLALMEYLITLITPPGGFVIDPFAGSGSTLCAAERLGVRAVGVEKNGEYVAIARERISFWHAWAQRQKT